MKAAILGIALVLSISLSAKDFDVGGSRIKIPEPKGFALVTSEMMPLYNIAMKMPDPTNDTLAFYISDALIGRAMGGEIPSYKRYMLVKVFRELRTRRLTSEDFADLSRGVETNIEAAIEKITKQLPGLLKKSSELLESELDVDVAMDVTQMVPLTVHYRDNRAFAFSMYLKMSINADGRPVEPAILSATITFALVGERMVYFYVYGAKEDLEWTRNASREWTNAVFQLNH